MPSEDGVEIVLTWYGWFYDNTESFEGALGVELAYLWPAILSGTRIEVTEESPLVMLLRYHEIPSSAAIWQFLYFEEV